MRTKFICIIWTPQNNLILNGSSWGLSLFVLFEQYVQWRCELTCSWGLSLFVLFEQIHHQKLGYGSSWGLSLFVLFERLMLLTQRLVVLED